LCFLKFVRPQLHIRERDSENFKRRVEIHHVIFSKVPKGLTKKALENDLLYEKKNIYFFVFVFFEKTENSLLSHLPTTIYQQKNHCCCQYSILYLEKNCYNKQGEDK